MTLFYLASRAAPSWYIQLNMCLKISGGNCLVALPWLWDQLSRLVTVVLKHSWAVALLKRLSTLVNHCSSIKIPSFGLSLCSWPPRGPRAPFEKPWHTNKSCKHLGSRPKRSIKPFYTNRTIKLTCMLTRLRTNLLKLEHHAGFAKLTRWIIKARHNKYSFAFSIHSDVRIKP